MTPDLMAPSISAVAGLAGTIVGGLVTYLTQKLALRGNEAREAAALAGSLAAEIDAYLHLMKRRDHITAGSAGDERHGRYFNKPALRATNWFEACD